MAKRFICGGQKYELGGQNGDSIGLPVFLTGLPEKIEAEGHTLLLKTNFHVSLICVGQIIERHSVATPNFVNKVVEVFCHFVNQNNVDFRRYRDEFRFVAQNERRSVVVMCDVSNLDRFFELMNKKYGLVAEYPPTHVTLYTLQPDKGIFLTNAEDMQQLTRTIPNPIGTAFIARKEE